MSAQFYIQRALTDIRPLRRRLHSLGMAFDPDVAVDIVQLASVVCDCEVIESPQLSERSVLAILQKDYGVDIGNVQPQTAGSLAGALCVATNGFFRWMFIRAEDSLERKRFTIAHELGHLFIDALPDLERTAAVFETPKAFTRQEMELCVFSRCDNTEAPGQVQEVSQRRTPLTTADLVELRAHHFAAELLMPYEGIRRLVTSVFGGRDVRSDADRERLITGVRNRYGVSAAAARRRIEKDIRMVPMESDPNGDLFG